MTDYAYYKPYGLIKRFRHGEEYTFRPHKTYWTKFLIDKQERTVLGHKPWAWGKIILFYVCFYIAVAILVTICWYGFDATIVLDLPKWLQEQPGVSYAPIVPSIPGIEYDINSNEEIDRYISSINSFVTKYGDGTESFGGAAGCSPTDDYGYANRKPCIFLKVNRVYGFETDPYKTSAELPDAAPENLRKVINANPIDAGKGRIWVSCESDIKPDVTYKYFPAIQSVPASLVNVDRMKLKKNDQFYDLKDIERIVAVQISGIPFDKLIHFKCYFWAKNMEQDTEMKYSKNVGKAFIKFRLKITNIIEN